MTLSIMMTAVCLLIASGGSPAEGADQLRPATISVARLTHHGWSNSVRLSNGQAEAVIVPAIGRVMQFGLAGEAGVFWENRELDGRPQIWKPAEWKTGEWVNFGGDKSWPSPEGDWSNFTQRDWRPPPAFDGMPVANVQTTEAGAVVLTSPVDPFYGTRVIRTIQLDPARPVMRITTAFERVSGKPARMGVWVVTQLKEPVGLYVPVPANSRFPQGYHLISPQRPPSLKVAPGLLSLGRNPKDRHKIGNDAGTLLWVGEKVMCRIDSPRVPGAEYPDGGSSAEVYTNPDPLKYIELETLGPLEELKPGDHIERLNTYTLIRRTSPDPAADARRALRLPD